MSKILNYPGSKQRIAKWIIEKIPQHHSYLEPFCGSCAVLLNKEPSAIETINDIDEDVINLFSVIRDRNEDLVKKLVMTPYSRQEYERALKLEELDPVEKARHFLIRCWQGYGYRTCKNGSGWKNDVCGREAAYAMRNWYCLPGRVADVVERLRAVQIEHRPAIDVIERFNRPEVFIYVDPPYLLSTRRQKQYRYELTSEREHLDLLDALLKHRGTCAISGYDSELYNDKLQEWKKYSVQTQAESGKARTECLWVKEM